jgi:uncharacterized membrane protein (DUF373 family)
MIKPLAIFDRVSRLFFTVILLFLALGLLIGTVKLFLGLADLLSTTKVTGSYLKIVSHVLSLLILIELSRSLVDYFDTHRVRMNYIVDAGFVFILR